tara:strand:- start:253 stop:414 length:162 start_codon:yes stop_codon:yes gene_type:complete
LSEQAKASAEVIDTMVHARLATAGNNDDAYDDDIDDDIDDDSQYDGNVQYPYK